MFLLKKIKKYNLLYIVIFPITIAVKPIQSSLSNIFYKRVQMLHYLTIYNILKEFISQKSRLDLLNLR